MERTGSLVTMDMTIDATTRMNEPMRTREGEVNDTINYCEKLFDKSDEKTE